jgi:hypothetical protein
MRSGGSARVASRSRTHNPRYLRYSNAVSALPWIIDDIHREDASSWRRHKRTVELAWLWVPALIWVRF